ncbi:MAG: hypothetical protein HQL99_13335 [Magnetococcales bacterium]|nr:hypothetical protein [Magnetococcales bacterium]
MRREKKITIREHEITIREPLAGELLGLLKQAKEQDCGSQDIFGDHVLVDVSFLELQTFTDMTRETMDTLTLSELAEIGKGCVEFNPLFFGWRDKVIQAGQRLLQQPFATSNAPHSA